MKCALRHENLLCALIHGGNCAASRRPQGLNFIFAIGECFIDKTNGYDMLKLRKEKTNHLYLRKS